MTPRWPPTDAPTTSFYPLSKSEYEDMRRDDSYWNKLSKATRDYVEYQCIHRPDEPKNALTLVQVTSAAERSMAIEGVRATIPAEGLIQMLLNAIATGRMDNASEELKPAERVKAALNLLSYALPVAKSIEVDDRAEKSDRKRRTLKDRTKAELQNLSEAELRNLINQELEEA